jgi:hypothetical protein
MLAVVLLVAGCGGGGSTAGGEGKAAAGSAVTLAGETVDGERLFLADLRGRPALLNVWASWGARAFLVNTAGTGRRFSILTPSWRAASASTVNRPSPSSTRTGRWSHATPPAETRRPGRPWPARL